jgi:hypothetical protein
MAKILQVQLPISPKCNHKQEALLNNENIFHKFILLYVHGVKIMNLATPNDTSSKYLIAGHNTSKAQFLISSYDMEPWRTFSLPQIKNHHLYIYIYIYICKYVWKNKAFSFSSHM